VNNRIAWIVMFVITCQLTAIVASGSTGPGVTLIITPEEAVYGGSVTISGATAEDPRSGNRTVRLQFETPDGKTINRTTQLDEDMRYSFDLSPLNVAGQWSVTVRGPVSELGEAHGEFQVVPPGMFLAASIRSFSEGCFEAVMFADDAHTMIAAFPELPEKEDALDKMRTVRDDMTAMGTALATAAGELDTIYGLMDDLRIFPEIHTAVAEVAGEMSGHIQQMEQLRMELKFVHEEMNNEREHCRRFHFQKKGWNVCIGIVQAAFAPGSSLYSFASGKLKDAIKSAANKAADDYIMEKTGLTAEEIAQIRQAVKDVKKANEIIETTLDPKGDFSSLKVEGISFVAKQLMEWLYSKAGRNCRMYEAEITGELHIDYYTKGMVYMIARYPISGEMKVFFKKREPGVDIVRLDGQVQGKFGWQTGAFYPERTCMDVPGMTGIGFCVPRPPFIDYLDFMIRVDGEGKPDSLELQFEKASYDVPRIPYMFVSVLWSPYQIVPAVDFPKMDVPGAEWFFSRITATTGEQKTFSIPLVVDGDDVTIDHTITRFMDYLTESEFRASLTWRIEGKEDGI
jgi:hypothetical protein